MSVPAKQSWPRRAAFAGAVLATAVLAIGVMPRPAAAQYAYYYCYPAAGYFPLYAYPHYSYPFYGYLYGDGAWDSSRGDGDRAWRRGGRGHGG